MSLPRWPSPVRVSWGAALAAVFAVGLAMLPGAGSAGWGPLAFLPVVWLALHGDRRKLLAFLGGIVGAFAGLLALNVTDGTEEVRWSLLFLVSAGLIAAGVHDLSRRWHAAAAESDWVRRELERAHLRLEEAQALAQVGSWEWDLEDKRFTCSDELRRIYGIAPAASLDSRFVLVDSVLAKDRERVSAAFEQAVDARQGFSFEHRIERGDGAVRWLNVSGHMTGDREDRLPRISGTARDVTQAHLAQQRLERSNMELERYAYVISHDLSEPVRVMGGFARMLEQRHAERLNGEARRFIASIVKGAERMDDLIHALLAYARVGSEQIRLVEVDMNALVRDVLDTLASMIAEKQPVVTVGEMPVVHGDRVLLAQLLQNLIANALKFSGDESPRVEVSAAREPGGWTISVVDNGCGIDPRQADRIWAIFQRLHDGSHPGTGVGLAICKRIVERHGGQIWVRPAPGGGSAFSFSLPVAPGEGGSSEPTLRFSQAVPSA